jgi:hypothetical protein
MKFNNNYTNHIGKFIAENENNRFTQLETEGKYSLWKDTVTNKYYYSEPSGDEDFPRWFEAEYVASMRKDAWDAWDFESEADEDEFTDIVAYCDASGEIEREDGVWIEWFELKNICNIFGYARCACDDPYCVEAQIERINAFAEEHFYRATKINGIIEFSSFEKDLTKRLGYPKLCKNLESVGEAVLIIDNLQVISDNALLLSEELDRLTEMGVRVITVDGYFDSISPSSFDVIARKRKHNLPPHAVMLHRIRMAEYKRLGKPQGFVLEDVE